MEVEIIKTEYAAFYKEIGERIRNTRIKKGMSQEQLADKAQLSTSHVSEIERGNKELRISTLYRIVEALETPTDNLIRPHIPQTVEYYKKEFSDLLEGCTPAQIEFITRIVREVKKTEIS
ncbi:MAG: helix-turn-helix transcriptional regulator [Clostridia bacterium]|nr:helix-turn-helix transcriptional regulator [Clostridia bacterium]